MTASGIRSAMRCWLRSPSGFVSTPARVLRWLATAVTSSWRSCTARHWEAVSARLLSAFEQPFCVAGYELAVSASFGVAEARPGDDAPQLVRRADAAVYQAKHSGRAQLATFEEPVRGAVSERARLEQDLRRALADDAIAVAYQPIVALADGSIAGAEALARWTHPEFGPIAPEVFVAVAEESGLIELLGERVLTKACRDARPWIHAVAGFQLSVNLSPRQLDSADFAPRVIQILADTRLPGDGLLIEVAETAVLSQSARRRENLRVLGDAGIGLVIDDFGSAQSLAHLSGVHFDAVKLDRRFIAGEAEHHARRHRRRCGKHRPRRRRSRHRRGRRYRRAARARRAPWLRLRARLAIRPARGRA